MKINIGIVQGNSKIYVEADDPAEILSKLEQIEEIINKISSLSATSLSSAAEAIETDKGAAGLPLAPTEILKQSNAKTTLDRLMVIVYFLFKQGSTLVNVKDMSGVFKQALEPQPQNWGAMMNHASSKGWLAGGQKKDKIRAWSITRTGLEYVEKNLLRKTEVAEVDNE